MPVCGFVLLACRAVAVMTLAQLYELYRRELSRGGYELNHVVESDKEQVWLVRGNSVRLIGEAKNTADVFERAELMLRAKWPRSPES